MKYFYLIVILCEVFSASYGAGGGGHGSIISNNQGTTESDKDTTKLLRVGYPLALQCKISHDDKDTKLKVTWYKDNVKIDPEETEDYKILENSTLLVPKAEIEDVGEYRCQTDGLTPPHSFNITVVYLLYKSMPKSVTVLEGKKLVLTCEVEGSPMPTITWLKDGKDVEGEVNSSRYSLKENEKGTLNATYEVLEAEKEDRAVYACVIETADLEYNTTSFVRVKNMYAALWPFLGICAEVIILCLIIFVYEKRRAKADFEESDTDQPTEQKNTSEPNKDSVRQRK